MTRYEIVKHNDALFCVYSYVTNRDWSGLEREYKNFVAECNNEKDAQEIVDRLS